MSKAIFSLVASVTVTFIGGCSASTPAPGALVGTSMDDCPSIPDIANAHTTSGQTVVTNVCARDERGNYYNLAPSDDDATIGVLPVGHTYSVVYRFASGFVPSPTDVDPSATFAFVAPIIAPTVGVGPCGGLPEDRCSNMVMAHNSLQGDLLTQSLPSFGAHGQQVDAVLRFDRLMPATQINEGFNVRFYIGVVSCGSLTPQDSGLPSGDGGGVAVDGGEAREPLDRVVAPTGDADGSLEALEQQAHAQNQCGPYSPAP